MTELIQVRNVAPTPAKNQSAVPSERRFSRVGAVAALAGILLYGISSGLHPWTAPHETHAAFTDYAVEPYWALYHLGEFFGFLLMIAAILALAWRLRRGAAGVWATLGSATMLLAASVYAVFTAVDGVALGILVRRWAQAPPEQQDLLYEAAFAVRQIEGGLFSLQWLLFGVGCALFAAALFSSARSPLRRGWLSSLGWLSVVASFGALSFGVVQAQTGYTELSMATQAGLYLGVVWLLAVALFLHRYPEHSGIDQINDGASGA